MIFKREGVYGVFERRRYVIFILSCGGDILNFIGLFYGFAFVFLREVELLVSIFSEI